MLLSPLVMQLVDLAIEKGPGAWNAIKEARAGKSRTVEETIKKLEALPPAYQRKHDDDE